jgi:excisionase family DNA binding protein
LRNLGFEELRNLAFVADLRSRLLTTKRTPNRRQGQRPAVLGDICTVGAAARRLELHPKTVLRFIREGRLKATRIGKSYRILRADVDALAGVPAPTMALVDRARVTCIIDMPDVGPALAQKWATSLPAALNTRERQTSTDMRADVVYEPDRSHLKVIVVGAPTEVIPLIRVMKVWMEQLTDR